LSRSAYTQAGNRPFFSVDEELGKWIIEIRRHLHQHPEISFDESCLEVGTCWLANVAWRWLEQANSFEIT